MADFNGILKEAIDGGESLESAMRKAASLAAKEAIESLVRTEIKTILGYDRYDPSGKNSGDSRNGTYERTVQASLGPITVAVTDGLQGIDEAICSSYPKAKRQRRFVHLLRSACSKVRAADRREVADGFMSIARQEDAESGKKALDDFAAKWKGNAPSSGYGRRGRSICSPSMGSPGNSAASSTRTTGSNRSTSR